MYQENESKYSTLVVALQEVDRQIRGLDENLALLQGKTAEQRTALTETTVEIFARLDTQLSDLKSQGEETADLQTKLAEQDTDLQELRNRMVTQQELLSKTREELESSIQSHSESVITFLLGYAFPALPSQHTPTSGVPSHAHTLVPSTNLSFIHPHPFMYPFHTLG